MDKQNPPRTHDEAVRDLDYLIRLNQRHRRLYSRIGHGLRLTELFAGTMALAGAFGASGSALTVAGGLLAFVGMVSFALNPLKRSEDFSQAFTQYAQLRAKAQSLTMEEIDRLRGEVADPDYIEGLRVPSFNDTMRSHGFADASLPLSPWQKVMHVVA